MWRCMQWHVWSMFSRKTASDVSEVVWTNFHLWTQVHLEVYKYFVETCTLSLCTPFLIMNRCNGEKGWRYRPFLQKIGFFVLGYWKKLKKWAETKKLVHSSPLSLIYNRSLRLPVAFSQRWRRINQKYSCFVLIGWKADYHCRPALEMIAETFTFAFYRSEKLLIFMNFFNFSDANFLARNYVLHVANLVPSVALIPNAMKNAVFRVPLAK